MAPPDAAPAAVAPDPLAGAIGRALSPMILDARQVALSALRPLSFVVAQAQSVALGGRATPLRRPGMREVADLSDALTRMAAMLDQRARYIIAFAASVSHEFKTPLAGLRGAAELLEDNADTLPSEERARLLRILAGNTQRLDILVRRLLDMARADMIRPGAWPVCSTMAPRMPVPMVTARGRA